MKYLVVLFALVAIVAANPEPERERRGILTAGLPLAAPAIAVRPAIAAVAAPVLAPRVVAPIASPILPLGKIW